MRDAVGVGKRDPARVHACNLYSVVFYSPTELFQHVRDKPVQLLAFGSVHSEIPDVPAGGREM
jgi:hypothetical protein